MHRRPLLALLETYELQYPDESAVANRIRQLVVDHEDCFLRTCRPGHITGSAWLLSHDRAKCLLLHHRKLDRWLQPGGHADGQSDPVKVAHREAQEESGLMTLTLENDGLPLDLDVHEIPARYDSNGVVVEDAHEHHDIRFLFSAAAGEELVVSDESHELRWLTHDEVLNLTDEESVLRMMRKAGPLQSAH
ncbi:MAG: NUDIX hydrolase [Planctomycetota bacterium]